MAEPAEHDLQPFDPAFLDEAEKYEVLGPAYFDASSVAERFMAKFKDEQFEPLVKEFTDKFRDELWSDITCSLLSDTEMNLQGELHRMVDSTVFALLTGDKWAIERYPLAKYHDGEKVRAALSKTAGDQIAQARIADLEAENKRLEDRVKSLQGRY